MRKFPYHHVDVFASQPLSGNGLTVFVVNEDIESDLLQGIAREMRQFESVFVWESDDIHAFNARVFTMEEELPFAGHPVMGAAAVLHAMRFSDRDEVTLQFELPGKTVSATSSGVGPLHNVEMNQGAAAFSLPVPDEVVQKFLSSLNLRPWMKADGFPLQVVSTGLPYLIVPINSGLEFARITDAGFEGKLAEIGAKFVFVLDVNSLEGRTWDNQGRVEDIATGSAAGPAGAYLVRRGRVPREVPLVIHQGRFAGRPSELTVVVTGGEEPLVRVSGGVAAVGRGVLELPNSLRLREE